MGKRQKALVEKKSCTNDKNDTLLHLNEYKARAESVRGFAQGAAKQTSSFMSVLFC